MRAMALLNNRFSESMWNSEQQRAWGVSWAARGARAVVLGI